MKRRLRILLELGLQCLADFMFMILPRRQPSRQALYDCKIVSHRGEHDNKQIKENTLAAFERVQSAGVWGIELDVRWTRDLQPVVIHDSDTCRVFGVDLVVAEVSLQELQQRVPELPSLAGVVGRFGGNTHLMVELKTDDLNQSKAKCTRLQEIFSPLIAGVDYHFLALHSVMFEMVKFAGGAACMPVAEFNVGECSQQALSRGYAGISGHYLLLSNRLIRRHRQRRQKIGTGFCASRYCFYRELNRGVDWIFTDHALKLRDIQQRLLRDR